MFLVWSHPEFSVLDYFAMIILPLGTVGADPANLFSSVFNPTAPIARAPVSTLLDFFAFSTVSLTMGSLAIPC